MKITPETRPDGSTRYRVQHKDIARPGKYTTRRFDDKDDAAEFVRKAKIELVSALAWADEKRGGVSFRGPAGKTFITYASEYVTARTDLNQRSRDTMAGRLRQLARFEEFAQLPMGAITRTDVEALKRSLTAYRTPRGDALKSRTKNILLHAAFAPIRYAATVRDIPVDVTLGIKKFLVDDAKATCPITVPELDSILVHAAPDKRALYRVLLDSGLRISEALALTWDDVRDVGRGIYAIDVVEGKTRAAKRTTTMPADTYKMLNRTEGEPRLFPFTYDAVSSEWRRAVRLAQTPAHAKEFPVLHKAPTIHDLRHSHAGFLITNGGMNLALVAERLGHEDIAVTRKYYGRLVEGQTHDMGVVVARAIPRGTVQ